MFSQRLLNTPLALTFALFYSTYTASSWGRGLSGWVCPTVSPLHWRAPPSCEWMALQFSWSSTGKGDGRCPNLQTQTDSCTILILLQGSSCTEHERLYSYCIILWYYCSILYSFSCTPVQLNTANHNFIQSFL